MRRQRQRQRCAALAQPRAACLPRCRAAHPPAEPARAAQGLTAGASEPASPASHDLFKAMEEQKRKVYSNPIARVCCQLWEASFDPYGRFHSIWDVMILMLVFFSSFWEPLKAAFIGGTMSAGEWCVDLLFYADIVIAFWTGYDIGFEIVTDKKAIAKNYLAGWFWIDFFATVEWDLIVGAINEDVDASTIRLCKLIKIARLARASRLINRLTATWTTDTAYIEAIKFFIYVLIVAHVLACIFFLFPALVGDNVDERACRCYDTSNPLCSDPNIKFGTCLKPGLDLDARRSGDVDNIVAGYVADADACNATGGEWVAEDRALALDYLFHNKEIDGYEKARDCEGYADQARRNPALGGRKQSACELKCIADGHVFEGARGPSGPWGGDTEAYCNDMPHIHSCSWRLMHGGSDGVVGDLDHEMSQYLQSLYWSLTTMTTIGYGDRYPTTQRETLLCMFFEIFGLGVFALLLTQINNLNEVMGKEVQASNDVKNSIVGFMKFNELDDDLIKDVIYYLNFKSSSIAGFYFEDNDDRFDCLSPELRKELRVALMTPALMRASLPRPSPSSSTNSALQTPVLELTAPCVYRRQDVWLLQGRREGEGERGENVQRDRHRRRRLSRQGGDSGADEEARD